MNKPLAFVIEDDMDLSITFSEALNAAGFDVEVITSGDAALRRLATAQPQVVVLDLHLPQVPGTEILQHIRRDERLIDSKIIIATGDDQLADALQDQGDIVLLKPIGFMQLQQLARRLCGLPQ